MLRSRSSGCSQRPSCEVQKLQDKLATTDEALSAAKSEALAQMQATEENTKAGGVFRTSTQPTLNLILLLRAYV